MERAMAEHRVSLSWSRDGGPYERNNYRSDHTLRFEGGQPVVSSAAPEFGGDAAHTNPEELLVASLSSCHMLTFLAVAANRGYVLDAYADDAVGTLGKNEQGVTFLAHATLRPTVTFSGDKRPTPEEYEQLHARAHRGCFMANTVKTEVVVTPVLA
jgi:organic hydroperoxide reductase OsmC/OhrA